MTVSLCRLPDMPDVEAALTALEEIFFLSSVRTDFASDEERAGFLERWTGWYVREAPEHVLFAHDPENGTIHGYLTGCLDSAGAAALARTIPRYDLFADRFDCFPAHLHINVRPGCRDFGVGRLLIDQFADCCRAAYLPGMHLITAVGARNVPFYQRAGFTEVEPRGPLLFLGRSLN